MFDEGHCSGNFHSSTSDYQIQSGALLGRKTNGIGSMQLKGDVTCICNTWISSIAKYSISQGFPWGGCSSGKYSKDKVQNADSSSMIPRVEEACRIFVYEFPSKCYTIDIYFYRDKYIIAINNLIILYAMVRETKQCRNYLVIKRYNSG